MVLHDVRVTQTNSAVNKTMRYFRLILQFLTPGLQRKVPVTLLAPTSQVEAPNDSWLLLNICVWSQFYVVVETEI